MRLKFNMKRFVSLMMCAVMLFGYLPRASHAQEGAVPAGLSYWINGEEVTILDYTGSATELIIPEIIEGYPVTDIWEFAFSGCSSLTDITIPESVTSIGASAFSNCRSLLSICIPNSVTSIGNSAFYGCHNLTDMIIPESVTSMGDKVFYACRSLTNVDIRGSVSSIGYRAFYGCSNLTTVTIPAGVTTIGDSAFYNCSSLTDVVIPDSVTSIGDSAFFYCDSLVSVVIPNGVTGIRDKAFYGCSNLTTITIPAGVATIGDSAFYHCSSLTDVIIPDSVTSIGDSAFGSCFRLAGIVIPDGVTSIGDRAFYDCGVNSGITVLSIPQSVTEIGDSLCEARTLSHVAYAGTLEQWNNIKIGQGNSTLLSVEKFHYESQFVYEQDCEKVGIYCPVCDAYILMTTKPDGEHRYEEIQHFASCTEDGYCEYICVNCADRYTQIQMPAYGHNEVIDKAVAVTCTESGLTEGKHCDRCNEIFIAQEEIAAVGHSYVHNVIPPTQTEQGYTTHTCQVCGYSYTDSYTSFIPGEPEMVTGLRPGVGYKFGVEQQKNDSTSVWLINGEMDGEYLATTSSVTAAVDVYLESAEGGYCLYFEQASIRTYIDVVQMNGVYRLTYTTAGEHSIYTLNEETRTVTILMAGEELFLGSYGDAQLISVYPASVQDEDNCSRAWFFLLTHTPADGNDPADPGVPPPEETTPEETTPEETTPEETIPGESTPEETLPEETIPQETEPENTEPGETEPTTPEGSEPGETEPESPTPDTHVHSYGPWHELVPADCINPGKEKRICQFCNLEEYRDTEPLGHLKLTDGAVSPTCTQTGLTEGSHCSRCGYVFVSQEILPALGHDFTDWILETEPTIETDGVKYRLCRRCGLRENASVPRLESISHFTVVNAQTLEPIQDAHIRVTLADGSDCVLRTDAQGRATASLAVGTQAISAYADGCRTRNLNIKVKEGVNEHPKIGLSALPVYNVQFNQNAMTLEEIEAAGIDTSAPENQHVFKYELRIEFEPQYDEEDVIQYEIDWCENDAGTIYPGISKAQRVENDVVLEVVELQWIPWSGAPCDFQWYAKVPPIGNEPVTYIYPASEYYYLIVRGEVRWVKEMFDVEMLIVNNSMTDTLEDLTATLELPDGLSLATMVNEQQSLVQNVDLISEGKSHQIHWYVRGDKAGNYSVQARLQGMTMPFEEEIDDLFITDDQIHVWAGDALRLDFEIPNTAYTGLDYPITVTLTNVSDITLYNVSHLFQFEEGMVVTYHSGKTVERIEQSHWERVGVREFHPGDKLVIQAYINIFFDNGYLQKYLHQHLTAEKGAEQLINAITAMSASSQAVQRFWDNLNGAQQGVAGQLSSAEGQKQQLLIQLEEKLRSLQTLCRENRTGAFQSVVYMSGSQLQDALSAIAEDPAAWIESNEEKDISALCGYLTVFTYNVQTKTDISDAYGVFETMRALISAIPIRYVVRSVTIKEDENNTTRIPWTVTVTESEDAYFGVSYLGKYLMSMAEDVFAGEGDGNWCYQLMEGIDDISGDYTAVINVQTAANEAAQFKIKDSTDLVTFIAWVERADSAVRGQRNADMVLSCDDENAQYENGVLTFTGDTVLSVTPQGQTDGTLYIQGSDGSCYTYAIDVVQSHGCVAGDRQVILPAGAENDGFGVRCCQVCGEIMEIIPLLRDARCQTHTVESWEEYIQPGCAQDGIMSGICTACGVVEYKTIPALGHNEVIDQAVAATCTSSGLTEGKHCDRCNEIFIVQEEIATVGHSYVHDVIPPTETEQGYTIHVCQVCGECYTDSYTDPTGSKLPVHELVLTEDTFIWLNLENDLYVDLCGYDLNGIIQTNGYQIYCVDSSTDNYSCENMGYFRCTDINGDVLVPQKLVQTKNLMRYMTIETKDGFTFHRFYLGITHASIAPSVTGFGYKAEFRGDAMVQEKVLLRGYNLWLAGHGVVDRWVNGFSETLTLRLNNFDVENHGETSVNANVYVWLRDGTVLSSSCYSLSLRQAVEAVNTNYVDYGQSQLQAVREMIQANPIMQTWQVENLLSQEQTPYVEVLPGVMSTIELDNHKELETLTYEYKLLSGDSILMCLMSEFSGWIPYYGDYALTDPGTAYEGVSYETLPDGYTRVTFTISQLEYFGEKPEAAINILLFNLDGADVTGYIRNVRYTFAEGDGDVF